MARKHKARPGSSAVAEKTLALMREVTGLPIYGSTEKQLHNAIRSGVLLVQYSNALFPDSLVEAHKGGADNKILARDNIEKFIKVARNTGISEAHLFTADDVQSARGLSRIHFCLAMLKALASHKPDDDPGPVANALPDRRLRSSITSQDGLPPPPNDLITIDELDWISRRGGKGCEIENVEERAVTLAQLEAIFEAVRERCAAGGSWWCLEEQSGDAPSWEARVLPPQDVHLDHFLHTVARPATRARNCSFVELMATGPQPPEWVASLVWAEPIESLVACIRQHAADRGYDRHTAIWIDVLANRRADFAAPYPTSLDLRELPCYRATKEARGMLVVADTPGSIFSRVAFGIDMHAAISAHREFLLDIYTAENPRPKSVAAAARRVSGAAAGSGGGKFSSVTGGPEVFRITDGELVFEDLWEKSARECDFPHELTGDGLRYALDAAQPPPARQDHKAFISEFVSSSIGTDVLNHTVRSLFLLPMIPLAVSNYAPDGAMKEAEALLSTLAKAHVRRVHLNFGSDAPENWVANKLVPALPPSATSLALNECNSPQLCAALAASLFSKHDSAVTTLDLSSNGINGLAMTTLTLAIKPTDGAAARNSRASARVSGNRVSSSASGAASLTSLELYGNPLGDEGVSILCEALEANVPLRFLGLQAVGLADTGACALAGALAANIHLVELVLRGNEIGDEGAYFLSEGLKLNRTLVDLDLFCNLIEERGAQMLAGALEKNKTLTAVNLDTNDIGDEGAVALATALLTNKSLIELDVGSNREHETGATSHLIGERGAEAFAKALTRNASLARLDLGGNNIGNKGATSLADGLLGNSALTSLALYSNQIFERGANSLSSALAKTKSLRELDLNSNSIADMGAVSIAEALEVNHSLHKINLGGNQITDQGASALAKMLRANGTLLTLKLGSNKIGEKGCAALAGGLASNKALTKLGLGENKFGDSGADALAHALEANTTLTRLFVWHNKLSPDATARLRKTWVRGGRLIDDLVC
jgi:Ran GTPase-activating protein (RanGAP) involved in mRNA processing and transport